MAYSALTNIRFSRRPTCKRKDDTNIPIIYLGSVQTLCPVGEGICGSVEEIFENCRIKLKHNLLPEQSLQIRDHLFELCNAHGLKTVYKFSRIVYCGVDGKRRKILVFNYHCEGEDGDVYLTHAFLCENKSTARHLAFTVAEYFQSVKFRGEDKFDEASSEYTQMLKKPGALKNSTSASSKRECRVHFREWNSANK